MALNIPLSGPTHTHTHAQKKTRCRPVSPLLPRQQHRNETVRGRSQKNPATVPANSPSDKKKTMKDPTFPVAASSSRPAASSSFPARRPPRRVVSLSSPARRPSRHFVVPARRVVVLPAASLFSPQLSSINAPLRRKLTSHNTLSVNLQLSLMTCCVT